MEKIYYLLQLRQESPLRLSTGEGETSDNDLMKDGRGYPYIPGSSLTGVLRSLLPKEKGDVLFGRLTPGDRPDVPSQVIVSDAVLHIKNDSAFVISVRDGVGIDEQTGVAKDTAKYDFEVVECNEPYYAVLEATDCEALMDELFSAMAANDGLRLGGRTTRGYGRMKTEIRRQRFTFPKDLQDWMKWNAFAPAAWEKSEPYTAPESREQEMTVWNVDFRIDGNFTVRSFSVDANTPEDVDYTFMKTVKLGDGKEHAVIPGTSWAGVFRHHMLDLLDEVGGTKAQKDAVNQLFGVPENQQKESIRRSEILFSESMIEGGTAAQQLRIAVDRFTMIPRDGALFKQIVCYGGHGKLRIVFPARTDALLQQLLNVCLLDLHHGLLHIGGEGSVGRGLMKITGFTVNGRDETGHLLAGQMAAIKEVLV